MNKVTITFVIKNEPLIIEDVNWVQVYDGVLTVVTGRTGALDVHKFPLAQVLHWKEWR